MPEVSLDETGKLNWCVAPVLVLIMVTPRFSPEGGTFVCGPRNPGECASGLRGREDLPGCGMARGRPSQDAVAAGPVVRFCSGPAALTAVCALASVRHQ